MEILNVQHLCKTYGSGETRVEALKDASFTLQKGEFAAVVASPAAAKARCCTASARWTPPPPAPCWWTARTCLP